MSAESRRRAVRAVADKRPTHAGISFREKPLLELFGANVFGEEAMRENLPASAYQALRESIDTGGDLDPRVADIIANAMKEWAVERGATHFTHWFQPMTGLTAEKHDSFLSFSGGRLLLEFSGKQLIKGEPDASSFPSGGIRSTFEARGYTAWDPTSPAFLREAVNGTTLCIPTAFCSWTGEALDEKTPLLRSIEALSREAVRLLHILGDVKVHKVDTTLGCEQEYFLIDRNFFLARPDLVATGRTLIGARPPKGQELEDHYFGTISPRVLAFMNEVELELWRLGVPVKTRHNEVAPSQFEIAPVFQRASVASDHNMLVMEMLRQVATRHGFTCLLHEKPFAGINGSGKHNNWSMATDAGENLLEPGKTPEANMRFMVLLTAILRGIDLHADLLRCAIARAGNDHRLGANEAPPAILSVYLGEELDAVLRGLIEGTAKNGERRGGATMRLGVSHLPELPRDMTDRNRTSPFAFTGNKFEFRAVGASQSVAAANMKLNTIVAESMRHLGNEIEKAKAKEGLEAAVQRVVQQTLREHSRVVFNGDNYARDWQIEAKRRGLPNLPNTVDAIARYASAKNIELFESMGVLSRREVEARRVVLHENYIKAIMIEAQSCLAMASTAVLPAAICHQEQIANSVAAVHQVDPKAHVGPQQALLRAVTSRVNELVAAIADLQKVSDDAESYEGELGEHARYFRDRVIPAMERTREASDALESLVDDDLWPLPKYREMLFLH